MCTLRRGIRGRGGGLAAKEISSEFGDGMD